MYLINTRTAELHYFVSSHEVRYAILSHVWQANELSFKDVQDLSAACALSSENLRDRVGAKIRDCCIFAERAGYEWLWVDTCCINHDSSAELSEAINSMFAWYADADVCYAYLYDVGDDDDPASPDSAFRRSRWYERGWTLQELIAPARIVFLSQNWCTLGSKHMLADVIAEVTAVQKEILTHERSLDSVSVAQRMSWAAKRKTTRIEDRAYSLLGIFGINLPTIYGEGERAFVRLQEEILRRIPDQSIFAWGPMHRNIRVARDLMERDRFENSERAPHGNQPNIAFDVQGRLQDLLAPSPSAFANASGFKPTSVGALAASFGLDAKMPHYALTSHGVRTRLPLSAYAIDSWKSWMARTGTATTQHVQLGLLACENAQGDFVVLLLRRGKQAAGLRYAVGEFIDGIEGQHYHRGAFLSRSLLREAKEKEDPVRLEGGGELPYSLPQKRIQENAFWYTKFDLKELYIHHPGSQQRPQTHPDGPIHEVMAPIPNFTFVFPHWLHVDLESRHGLVCEQTDSADGCALTVPCHLTAQQVNDAVVSALSFFDAARRERLTVRIGVGSCRCFAVPFPGPHGTPLHKLWVDVLVARAQSRADAPPLEGSALPKLFGPLQVILSCPCAHIDFTAVRGDQAVICTAFGDDTRRVEVMFQKREGFELVRRIPCKSYTVTLALSGPVYDPASSPPCAVPEEHPSKPFQGDARAVRFELPASSSATDGGRRAVRIRRTAPLHHPRSEPHLHARFSPNRAQRFAWLYHPLTFSSMIASTAFT